MLKGKELGLAITKAIDLKIASGSIATKTEVARHFGVELPSLYGWMKRGTISKDKLPKLWNYFSDVVGADHWGLEDETFNLKDKEIAKKSDSKSDESWLDTLDMEQYALVKKFALKVADMGSAELQATDKIIEGTDAAIKAGKNTK